MMFFFLVAPFGGISNIHPQRGPQAPRRKTTSGVIPFPLPTPVPENHTFFGSFCVFLRSLRPAIPPLWCALWCHFPRTFRA
jgi:hypothetical protein